MEGNRRNAEMEGRQVEGRQAGRQTGRQADTIADCRKDMDNGRS